jgi:hypothetical protein
VVVSAATGEPVSGAYVGVGDFGDAGGSNLDRFEKQGLYAHTETDEAGRFELSRIALVDHPLVVTHPEYVRHDESVSLGPATLRADVKVSLKPAAKIRVTAVDADGQPLRDEFTFRLEALDGHSFIPPGKQRHLSSFASPSWMQDDVSGSFLFTELDEGEYSVDAMKRTVEPAPHDRTITHVDYYGGVSSVAVRPGELKEVTVPPQDYGTLVEIRLQGEALTTPAPPRVAVLTISRNTGLLVWDVGWGQGPEFPCLGRVAGNPLIRALCGSAVWQEPAPTAPFPEGPIRIRNLPPGSYSLFVYVFPQMVLEGRKVEVVRGQATRVTIDLELWEEMAPNLRNLDRRVRLDSREHGVRELCDLLNTAVKPAPRFGAVPSLRDETVRFEAGEMTVWEILEKTHEQKKWVLREYQDRTLILAPPSDSDRSVPSTQSSLRLRKGGQAYLSILISCLHLIPFVRGAEHGNSILSHRAAISKPDPLFSLCTCVLAWAGPPAAELDRSELPREYAHRITDVVAGAVTGQQRSVSTVESQPSREGQTPSTAAEPEADAAIFWPTDKVVENWVVLFARMDASPYGLSDEQVAAWERMSVQRWKPFFFEIRLAWLLARQFCEARFAPQPPDIELVKRWAKHARPVLETIRDQFSTTHDEFKLLLEPEQKVRYEDNFGEFDGVLGEMVESVRRWEQGEVRKDEWWESDPQRRESIRRQWMSSIRWIEKAGVSPPPSHRDSATTTPAP